MSHSEKYISDSDVEGLIEDGMPPEVANVVQNHPGLSKAGYAISVTLFILTMIALMMSLALLPVFPPFQNWLRTVGKVEPDALLIHCHSVSSVLGVFLGIFLTGILFSLVTLCNRKLAILTGITQIHKSLQSPKYEGLNRALLRSVILKVAPNETVAEYFMALPKATLRVYGKGFFGVLALTVIVMSFDIGACCLI